MNVVGREAISPAGNAVEPASLRQKIAIKRIIARHREQRLAPIAALGDVVGDVRDDDAGEACDGGIRSEAARSCEGYDVPVI